MASSYQMSDLNKQTKTNSPDELTAPFAEQLPHKRNRSTGPTTDAGKNQASRNSETHGCTSSFPVVNGRLSPQAESRLILADERVEDWEAVKASWHQTYQPQSELHWTLVTQAAVADWMERRTLRRYNEAEQELSGQQADVTSWTDEQHAKLERFGRYHVRAQRSFQRARRALEQLRIENKRDAEKAQPPTPAPAPSSARNRTAASKPAAPAEQSLTTDSLEGAVQLLPRTFASLIQCVTVQVLDGKTFTLFQPRSENLTRMILNAPEPKPAIKRALYFLDGIPSEYEWITEYESHNGRPHYVITRTSRQALQDLENELEDGSGHVLPVSLQGQQE